MKSRTRFIVACVATLVVLLPLGWMWNSSLMPDTYSVMDMGRAEYGMDAKGKPIPAPSTRGMSTAPEGRQRREGCKG